METYGEFITESKKVTYFLRGISDPLCQVAKGIVIATPAYFNNFTKAAQYIASTLNITLSVNRDQNRNIGSTTTNNGRTQGGKNNRKGNKKLTRSYSPAKWRALSKEEKKRIIQAQNKANRNKDDRNSQVKSDGKRNINGRAISAVDVDNLGQDNDESYIEHRCYR